MDFVEVFQDKKQVYKINVEFNFATESRPFDLYPYLCFGCWFFPVSTNLQNETNKKNKDIAKISTYVNCIKKKS